MSGKAMSLKARIRNLAKEKGLPAQVILQNYMFERFLERLSKSEYKDKFIIKGGLLIASLVGLDNRTTMDLDATLKNYPLNIDAITKSITDICSIDIDDGFLFTFIRVDAIRDDDEYGGYRAGIMAEYETINIPMQMDITAGDSITPKEVMYPFNMIFTEETFCVLAYNIETILAEKVETIMRRGELNTRPRDFYDVYILAKTQKFDQSVFASALKQTTAHRGTSYIFDNVIMRVEDIQKNETLKSRWKKYTRDYNYAKNISYMAVMDEIIKLLGILNA